MADFTMGNGTFYRNGVNFGECDVLTTHSQEFDVLTTHSREFDVLTTHALTSHFIGETSGRDNHVGENVQRRCVQRSNNFFSSVLFLHNQFDRRLIFR